MARTVEGFGEEDEMIEGGCACGGVRYRITGETYDTGWCHCRLCQHMSGSGGLVFTTAALRDFAIVEGAERVATFASTPFGERAFCRDCGSPLSIHVRHQPDEIDIAAGSLDDPEAARPGFHLYADGAPRWMNLDDDLPRFAALRPVTRGLAPGQTRA